MTDAQTVDSAVEPTGGDVPTGMLATIPKSPRQLVAGTVALVAGLVALAMSFVDWAEYPAGPNGSEREMLSGMGGTLPDGTSYGSGSPAAWSAVLGALIACGGVAILTRRVAGAAGLLVALAGAAGFVLACVYIIDPLDAFGLPPVVDLPATEYFPFSGGALWGLFGATLLGTIAGAQALALALGRDRAVRS